VSLLVSQATFGQEEVPAEPMEAKDTVQISFFPKGLRLGVDVLGAAKSMLKSDKTELEFSADVALHRYLINLEYGQFEIARTGADGSAYHNEGSYFRTGIDINLFKKDTDVNVLFFGLRYGKASFDDQLTYPTTSTDFGDNELDQANVGLGARWFEMTSGLKLHVAHNIWLGFTNRLKFSLKIDETTTLTPHDVPGYGLAGKENYWGFNYYVIYRIPFKKAK
jgi:hypothetical protein